jgi:hypothetical protein
VSVTSCGLDLNNTLLNGEKRDMKSTASKVKYKNILLTNAGSLLVKTICNSSSGQLIDKMNNIYISNYPSILGGVPLGVIEVAGTVTTVFLIVLAR